MLDEFKELDKMIEQLKADDTALESLDQFNHFANYAIENINNLIATNEQLIEIVKAQNERISELEGNIYGANH